MSAVPSIEYTAWVDPSTDYAAKSESLDSLRKKTNGLGQMIFNQVWPIGSIYTTTVNINPGTTMGFGTWLSYSSTGGTFSFTRTA